MNKTCHNCGVKANVYLPSRCINCQTMGFSRRELWYPRHTIPVDQPERVLVVSGEGRIITGAEGRVESKGKSIQSDNSAHLG